MEFASGPAGVKVALFVAVLYATEPATTTPVTVFLRLNVVVLIVDGFIGSLNVTVTELFVATPAALFGGDTASTAGGVLSAVMNVHDLLAANGLPARSLAPVETVAV